MIETLSQLPRQQQQKILDVDVIDAMVVQTSPSAATRRVAKKEEWRESDIIKQAT